MNVQGGVAVVTGAGNGIGRAIAFELGRRGARVVVADVEPEAAVSVTEELHDLGIDASAHPLDVTDAAAVEQLAEVITSSVGPVRILVNNAGVSATGAVLDADAALFDWAFAVNVGGVHNGCRSFGRRMAEAGAPAWIVNVGSEHSLGVPHVGSGLYTATKHAVLGLSDVLRRELPEHVGVSVLCPGLTQSSFWRGAERRPERFGGPGDASRGAERVMAQGMPAEEVALRVAEGIEAERFLILTHSHVVDFAEERWETIREACAEQVPPQPGDERYMVATVLGRLREEARDAREGKQQGDT